MAMTAWSANVSSSAISRVGERAEPPYDRQRSARPIDRPCRSGTATSVRTLADAVQHARCLGIVGLAAAAYRRL